MLPLPEVAVAALFAHQCLISTHRALLPCVSHFLPSSHSGRIISSSPCVIRGSLDEYAASALVACLPDFAIKYIPNDDVFSYANERPSRRLGATFILLLCAIVSLCYAFTRFLSCELELTSQYQWDIIRPGEHCLRYATREYTSRLVQVSGLQDPPEAMRACHETPVQIHRRLLKPDWCQDLGFGRGIYGFWIVDSEEADCETHWGKFNDLGCYDFLPEARSNSTEAQAVEVDKGSVRRIESRLENLKDGSNWQIMCVTTPAEIYGRRFGSPAACFNDIRQGVYGKWDVEDTSCG